MKWILPIFPFTKSLDYGAEAYLYLILDLSLDGVTGKYFDGQEQVDSSVDARDETKQNICWEWSCKITGIEKFGF